MFARLSSLRRFALVLALPVLLGTGTAGLAQGYGSNQAYGGGQAYGNGQTYGGQQGSRGGGYDQGGGYAGPQAGNQFRNEPNAGATGIPSSDYSMSEVLTAGHNFFGATSGGLAQLLETAFQRFGLPNGYVLGEQAGGAFFGGLRYGEGKLFTKNAGNRPVFWQGPSLGLDVGGDGARAMMLVYNLPSIEGLFGRYGGVSGSAYLVGGLGMTVLVHNNTVLVPVTTGVGARLGINVGYLKLTPQPTWNPF